MPRRLQDIQPGELSPVQVVGEYASPCGYCGAEGSTSVAFGMSATEMSVQTYQDLIDVGWRRSGTWLYFPIHAKTCCACYVHRLEVANFKASKAQRRVARKFEAYVAEGQPEEEELGKPPEQKAPKKQKRRAQAETTADVAVLKAETAVREAIKACLEDGTLPASTTVPQIRLQAPAKEHLKRAGVQLVCPVAFPLASAAAKAGAANAGPFQIAEALANRLSSSQPCRVEATGGYLNFFLKGLPAVDGPGRRVAAANDRMREDGKDAATAPSQEEQHANEATAMGSDQDTDRRNSGEAASSSRPFNGLGAKSNRLKIALVPSSPALVDLEFPLFRKYQVQQHGDDPHTVSRQSFRRFLIDSPLVRVAAEDCSDGTAPSCGFGSFHQQYWIDGVLVAVGVVDILPACLSSKYFFWDPDLASLSLGKVSAMMEIEWVRAASESCPSLRYYYMGYYIHTCPKMRYKVDFTPAELLCPEKGSWIHFSRVKAALDADHKTSFSALTDNATASKKARRAGTVRDMLVMMLRGASSCLMRLGEILDSTALRLRGSFLSSLEELHMYAGPAAERLVVCLGDNLHRWA